MKLKVINHLNNIVDFYDNVDYITIENNIANIFFDKRIDPKGHLICPYKDGYNIYIIDGGELIKIL